MYLNFKGLIFDEFVDDRANDEEFPNIWATMCRSCARKYRKKLGNRLCKDGSGCCSVYGCENQDGEFYVDFNPSEVEIFEHKEE